ncbi:hypothetical protein [Frondihabitans sp. PhB188]|uniref:hypothetical protein n=1 Tax=Frondihabitans sp. PhB188 TaxID=2485200 RepID=UPI000F490976|nr:hypothetical protein [Frondihabitans sp. PhB188]
MSGNGDTIVVGASNYGAGTGAVYVFQRTSAASWAESARLNAPAGANAGAFGNSVAISDDGTKILAGAPAGGTTTQGGAAYYVLISGTWTLKTVVAGGSASALGGQSVALSADGTRAAVGAPQYKAAGSSTVSGRVYSYTATTTGLTTLASIVDPSTATTVSSGPGFGGGALSFTADNNGLLAAAPYAATAAGATSVGGMAYYYRYSTSWTRSATFSLTNTTNARLGYSGAISPDGNRIILGAPYYAATAGGREFISEKSGSTWGVLTTIGPLGNNSTSSRVGISSAFGTNSRLVIGGNMQKNSDGIVTGLAYLVDIS